MLRALLPWIWYSNLHIVFVAAGVLLSSYAIAQVPVHWSYVLMASCGALIVYHVDRALLKSPEDSINAQDRVQWFDSRMPFVGVSTFFAAIGAIWGATQTSTDILMFALVMGFIGLFYSVPVLTGKKRLKDYPFLKTALILCCWVGGGVLLPVVGQAEPELIWAFAAYRTCSIIPNLLVADWVDQTGDRKQRARGQSRQLTESVVRQLSAGTLAMALVLSGVFMSSHVPAPLLVADALCISALTGTVIFSRVWNYKLVIGLDLLVGLSIVTWVVHIAMV